MFERGVVTESKKRQYQVIVTLDDGTVMRGACSGVAGSLGDILASGGPFMELTDPSGSTAFLAKSAIRTIEPADIPAADQLEKRQRAMEGSDSFAILGLSEDADENTLSEVYRQLSKAYHPDRLTGQDMPKEIIEYAAAMQRRINVAFEEVRSVIRRNAAAARPETVFEHRPAWAAQQAGA